MYLQPIFFSFNELYRILFKIEYNYLAKIVISVLLFNTIYVNKLSRNNRNTNIISNGMVVNKRNFFQSTNYSNKKYCLVLDLDETLIHFFYVINILVNMYIILK